jgi:hypothetical protein
MTTKLRRTALVAAAAATLIGGGVLTASSASATADNCGTNGNSGVYNCMYVQGSGSYASEVRGWSQYDGFGYPVHEQVTANNATVCNSPTVTTSNPYQVVGCQVYPKKDITPGVYCSVLWEYINGEYYDDATNCVGVD